MDWKVQKIERFNFGISVNFTLVLLADTSVVLLIYMLVFELIVLSVSFPTSNLQGCCYKELLSKNSTYYSVTSIPEQGELLGFVFSSINVFTSQIFYLYS